MKSLIQFLFSFTGALLLALVHLPLIYIFTLGTIGGVIAIVFTIFCWSCMLLMIGEKDER